MDGFDLVIFCIAVFASIMFVKSMFRVFSGGSFSPVGIFANLIGLFSAVYLYVNKASVLETFNIFKDMFVKSAKSKSPLELAVWFVVLVLIILLPTRRSA